MSTLRVVMELVEIRTNFPPDDGAISRLHALAFGGDPMQVSPWAERLQSHSIAWAGAFFDGELIAFVHVVWDGGAHGFLLDTAVHRDHQRHGLGKAVVGAVAEQAAAPRCQWLHVDYEPHLDRFYRDACGFTATAAGLLRLR